MYTASTLEKVTSCLVTSHANGQHGLSILHAVLVKRLVAASRGRSGRTSTHVVRGRNSPGAGQQGAIRGLAEEAQDDDDLDEAEHESGYAQAIRVPGFGHVDIATIAVVCCAWSCKGKGRGRGGGIV